MSGPPCSVPYFHVEIAHAFTFNRYYRVYVWRDEMFFLDAGPGNFGATVREVRQHQGLSLEYLLADLFVTTLRKPMLRRAEKRARQLDEVTVQELPGLVAESRRNFVVSLTDLNCLIGQLHASPGAQTAFETFARTSLLVKKTQNESAKGRIEALLSIAALRQIAIRPSPARTESRLSFST